MRVKTKNNQQGFTIVELLIVIVVIGILAAITIVAYNGIQNRGKAAAAQSLANAVAKKAEAYNTVSTTGAYPAAVANFAEYTESKLDDTSVVVTTVPTASANTDKVSYKKCTTGAQITYWNLSVGKAIAIGLGGQASTAADGSGTTATLCT